MQKSAISQWFALHRAKLACFRRISLPLVPRIKQSEFAEMKSFGINVIRLPLGYWNLVDMPGNPNAPSSEAIRMGQLKDIMKAADYRQYIDLVTQYARDNDIQVLYDLHGAPGS